MSPSSFLLGISLANDSYEWINGGHNSTSSLSIALYLKCSITFFKYIPLNGSPQYCSHLYSYKKSRAGLATDSLLKQFSYLVSNCFLLSFTTRWKQCPFSSMSGRCCRLSSLMFNKLPHQSYKSPPIFLCAEFLFALENASLTFTQVSSTSLISSVVGL